MARLPTLLSSFFFTCFFAEAFDPTSYHSNVALSDAYTLHHRVENSRLYVALEVETTGFVGLGFPDPAAGGMLGADVVTAHVDDESGPVATDRYFGWTSFPKEDVTHGWPFPDADESQDWTIEGGEQVDGTTVVELSRSLTTADKFGDREVASGPVPIIWAYGGSDVVTYHGVNRGVAAVSFFGDLEEGVPDDADGEIELALTTEDTAIPIKKTVYWCKAHKLEEYIPADTVQHAVQFDVEIGVGEHLDTANLHHVLAYACPAEFVPSDLYTTPTDDSVTNECVFTALHCDIVWAWALGGGKFTIPDDAGLPIGPGTGKDVLVVSTHYDNPGYEDGVQLQDPDSRLRIHTTSKPRTHEAAVLLVGDPFVTLGQDNMLTGESGLTLKAGDPRIHVETTCDSACTETWDHEITVFGSFLHLHSYGHQIWSSIFRDGEMVGETNRNNFWDNNFQKLVEPTSFNLKPGDRLNTHCIWDMSRAEEDITFGLGGENEMCMEFLFYYPALKTGPTKSDNFGYCSYLQGTSMCGTGGTVLEDLPANPSVIDTVSPWDPVFSGTGSHGLSSGGGDDDDALVIGLSVAAAALVVIVAALVMLRARASKDSGKSLLKGSNNTPASSSKPTYQEWEGKA